MAQNMRIDSSGNLLVGTTVTPNTLAGASATQGVAVNGSTGYLVAAANGTATAYFNRQTSDGGIVEFRKDGSTVGSIGVKDGGIGSPRLIIGEGDTGIAFQSHVDNSITPIKTDGGNRDNVLNLGAPSHRFKDLYLSGGVYLGGTGSANKLDDVEFGTFNPTIAGSTSTGAPSSYTKREGRYAKMGHLVHVQITLGWSSHTGTGNMSIRDLPFLAVSGGITGQSVLSVGYNAGLSRTADRAMEIYVANGTSQGNFTETAANGDIQGLAIDANVTEIIIAGTYYSQPPLLDHRVVSPFKHRR